MRTIFLTVLIAVAAAPLAAANGQGPDSGYRSEITSIQPQLPGVRIEILEAQDGIRVVNEGSETVIVLGYEGEPYLRITPDAAYHNVRSPSTYMNEDFYGHVTMPDHADADAEPEWEEIDDDPQAEWHDHRVHWMSPQPPPEIAAAPDVPRHISDWEVTMLVGDETVVVAGTLDYEPPDESGFPPLLLVPLGLLAAGGVAAWWFRRRGSRAEQPS
jgi:hypothetical protein